MTARALLVIGGLVLMGGLIALVGPRLEGGVPSIDAPSQIVVGSAGAKVVVTLGDDGSGLREFTARILHGGGGKSLQSETFPGSWLAGASPGGRHRSIELDLDVSQLHIPDGSATLVLSARDWAWRDGFRGNRSEQSIPVSIDTRAPSVSLVSGLTYVRRGGSAAAVYRVSEPTVTDGVRVGEAFFPGFPLDGVVAGAANAERVSIFAIPINAPSNPLVQVVAVDQAGNQGSTRFPSKVLERAFAKKDLRLSDAFLENIAVPLAEKAQFAAPDPISAFQKVNTELRAANEEEIRKRIGESSPQRHWRGSFAQLAGSQVMSRFAEVRSYLLRGEKISQARHFGFDLASTAHAPITAAAAGVIRFADDLGIYGRCVLVDHGLGVTSLYGHLSSIDVRQGDAIAKHQVLGRSGETGLAGGDHLHFAILVGATYVDPLEWWDSKWVRSHIEVRLEPSSP